MPLNPRTRPYPRVPLRAAALVILTLSQAALAVTVIRGPYLELQTPNSMSVVWVTDTACSGEVEWGLTTGYGQVEASGDSATRHEIALGGLSPDNLYHYRVRCAGVPLTADATFRTAPPADATAVSFAFVGDSCSAPSNCTATYDAMLPQSVNGFCVTLGDLAGRGEDPLTDYWQWHFFSPAAEFIKQNCMFPCIGNHELYDETATYVYPQTYLDIWSLPTANSGSEFYYSFDKAHVHFAGIDTYWSSYAAGSAQHTWLASDLAATTTPWTIVFGHDGPYISEDGSSDGSTAMRTHLVPLFEQFGVDLYLHGNYHHYQRNEINGVHYIDQGTGGQPWSTKQADDSQAYVQAYARETYCFTRLDIVGNRLLGRCLRTSDGTVLDGYQVDKPPIARPWRDTFPSGGTQLNWIAPRNFESQCGLVARPGNPSGDGYVFQVADESGTQLAYPMLADESMMQSSIEAQIYYDAETTAATRCGIGVRGRQFFDAERRSYYVLMFVRNDALGGNGHSLLVLHEAGVETVLADWFFPDVSAWHKLKLAASGSNLAVWIDDGLRTQTPITNTALAKGRPFIYNYRAGGGAATLTDDVVISSPVAPVLITDFEGYADGTQVLFRPPTYSGSTNVHLAVSPDSCSVVVASAFGGTKVCQADWAFLDADPQRWLRLTTSNVANVPNPSVDLLRPIRFRCRLMTPGSLRVCVGLRETGANVPIGANGGKTGTIEWLGATAVANNAPQGVLISDQGGQWQTLTFDPVIDSVQAFTGDGLLNAPYHMGVLEHVAFASTGGAGPFSVQLDGFEQLPAGDLDGDGDTDVDDYAVLETCLTGPGGGVLCGCEWADLDYDADVDVRDYGRFQAAIAW